jgi:hypothetical protein
MWMTPLTRCFSRMGALRFGDLGPPVRAAVGRCPIPAGNCRASARACQRGKWSSWAGLTLRFAGDHRCQAPSQLRPHRPCPPRARSTGIWRYLTVNSGRSLAALTCAIGVASGVERLPGRAFQARDAGSIPVTRSTISTGSPATLSIATPLPPPCHLAGARVQVLVWFRRGFIR